MIDPMSPLPRQEADARYELARLAEILPQIGQHLRTLGVPAEAVAVCQQAATELRNQVAAARDATLMDLARRIA